ncbi:cytochrome P450 [Nocardia sp. XZ_19_385]|uniref:cytochrome P450 n=1 Tax=Nocardia sp. XZ_19_385 TaxID=2769488 RepID=UPI00188ED8F9|nr:cytochrome P450 [Nocardia sp. XZ_19_385]
MHVALFSDFHPATIGGIQSSIRAQRRGLEQLGHQVTVFTAPTPESTESDAGVVVLSAVAGLRVNGFAVVGPTRANNRSIDAEFAARGPIDVVHLHTTYGVAIAGLHAGRRHGIPVVQTIHSRDDAFIEHTSPVPYVSALLLRTVHGRFVPHRGGMPRVAESRAARHAWHTMVGQARAADRVIVPSEHFAGLLRAHGVDLPITVLSNGVDDELIEQARRFPPAEDAAPGDPPDNAHAVGTGSLGQPSGPLRALWCARLSPEKRLLEAIEAIRLAPRCTLDVYGTGELLERAETLIESGGLRDRVRLHGGVSQAECLAAMADHDVLLFPSSGFDTQGMALLEAVAMGLPVVYCDPDLAESVPEGGGICTPDPSVAAISATLRDLADDPAKLMLMRKTLAARENSVRQSLLTGSLVEVYQDVLHNPSRTNPTIESNSPVLQTIPTAPHRLPLFGHSVVVLRDALGFVKSLTALGPIVRVYLGPRPAYVLTTPELVREVGFGTAGKFHREELRETMQEVIRGASNVLSGEPHAVRRRMIAPALRQRRINEYAVTASDLANTWAERLPVGRTVDLVEEAHELVLDIISSTLFTADFTTAAKQEVRQNVPWLLEQVIVRAALPEPLRRLRFVANRRFSAKAARLRAEIGAVVAEYRRTDQEFPDVASALVHHVDPDTGARLTDAEIVDELLLMLAAGVGSTASILAWVWHEVLTHPDVEAELRRELADFVGDGTVRPDHVASLPYLRLVLLETLRYWAPWVSTHTADGPVTLGGTTLPDGAMIVYSPYLIHHNEHFYPSPETFDPDRWFPGRVEEIDKKAILPFGIGPRHCPGNTFALMTITLATAALFANRRATPDPAHRVQPKTRDFVPTPNRLPVVLRLAK